MSGLRDAYDEDAHNGRIPAVRQRRKMAGRTYLERGRPVVVLIRWSGSGPRNVLIRREDGSLVVRPFRGLRRTAQ